MRHHFFTTAVAVVVVVAAVVVDVAVAAVAAVVVVVAVAVAVDVAAIVVVPVTKKYESFSCHSFKANSIFQPSFRHSTPLPYGSLPPLPEKRNKI